MKLAPTHASSSCSSIAVDCRRPAHEPAIPPPATSPYRMPCFPPPPDAPIHAEAELASCAPPRSPRGAR